MGSSSSSSIPTITSLVYAHNSKVLVKEGQQVKRGEVIAAVGQTGKDVKQLGKLHFQIRKAGQAIDPLKLYPTLRRRCAMEEKDFTAIEAISADGEATWWDSEDEAEEVPPEIAAFDEESAVDDELFSDVTQRYLNEIGSFPLLSARGGAAAGATGQGRGRAGAPHHDRAQSCAWW